jgi:UDP-N-acetylmuramyl pentapeptide phosphotransferase/UDP-N-acetylglucosamine-1-phosphate transferase
MAMILTIVAVTGAVISWRATGWVLNWLIARRMVDLPNERSSHRVPTPRGGGIGLLAGLLPAWGLGVAMDWPPSPLLVAAPILALALAVISFIDDRRGLSQLPRLLAQALAIGIALALLPAEARVAPSWLPIWPERLLLGFAWLWFVNLYNFMDGIDGITGVETLVIALGLLALGAILPAAAGLAPAAVAVAGAATGFLVWNWPPARLFMGDVGSVPLGFLVGGLLVAAATAGAWHAALILPALHWADATLTLLRRMAAGEPFWRPHRSHFYQRAAAASGSHARVSLTFAAAGAVLIGLAAWAAAGWPLAALALAALITGATLLHLARVGVIDRRP